MGDMNPPPRPLGFSSMMQQQRPDPRQQPMNLSQNSLAGINQQQYQQRLQGLGSAPFAPPQPARRPGQGQFPASSATRRTEPPKGFQGASNPFGQRLMSGQGFITPGPRQAMDFSGSPLLQQQLQKRLAAQQATGPTGPTFAMPRPGEPPRTLQPLPDPVQRPTARNRVGYPAGSRYVPDQTGTPLRAAGIQRGAGPRPWFPSTQRPEYLPDQEAQQFVPWARGGRVGLKTGGRIPRKKGAKFI